MERAEFVPVGILPMLGSLDLGMDFVEEIQIPQFWQQPKIAPFVPEIGVNHNGTEFVAYSE